MFDYFVAELKCPRCSNVSGLGVNINMQTHIRDDADGSTLDVGYEVDASDLQEESIISSSYLLLRSPDSELIRLLNAWMCRACKTDQWAIVEIVDRKLARIEAVSMSRAVLEEANFITEVHAGMLAASLLDISWRDMTEQKVDVVTVLRRQLP